MARPKLPEAERRDLFTMRMNVRERERLATLANTWRASQSETMRRALAAAADRLSEREPEPATR